MIEITHSGLGITSLWKVWKREWRRTKGPEAANKRTFWCHSSSCYSTVKGKIWSIGQSVCDFISPRAPTNWNLSTKIIFARCEWPSRTFVSLSVSQSVHTTLVHRFPGLVNLSQIPYIIQEEDEFLYSDRLHAIGKGDSEKWRKKDTFSLKTNGYQWLPVEC